jgi:hypothetical protein
MTAFFVAAMMGLCLCSGCGAGHSQSPYQERAAKRLRAYVSSMKQVQIHRSTLLRAEDTVHYARIGVHASTSNLRRQLSSRAVSFSRLGDRFDSLASAAESIPAPKPLTRAHAQYVASLRIAASREYSFARDLRRLAIGAIIAKWNDELDSYGSRITDTRRAWRSRVVRYSHALGIEPPKWVREVGTLFSTARVGQPLASYIRAATVIDDRRVATYKDPNEAANSALTDVRISFETWYDTVLRFVGGGASLSEVERQSRTASFAASEAIPALRPRAHTYGEACIAAVMYYAKWIQFYANNLGSGSSNDSYSRAAQGGQHVEEKCASH